MSFFNHQSAVSAVKARIIAKYFATWAKVIAPTAKKTSEKVGYIDLFAGPGRYRDGSMSTPLLILKAATEDAMLSQLLVSMFNDQDIDHSETLRNEIQSLPNICALKHAPVIRSSEIGDTIASFLSTVKLIPSFTFVDPFGYKGLSLKIVNAVIKDWGCDCVFFFNYMRINSGISNPNVTMHMDALFGTERANKLRSKVKGCAPAARENLILKALEEALKTFGAKHILPFAFKTKTGSRTSHYLIFVSKSFKGEEIMKGIMASESTSCPDGVPSFEYSPVQLEQPQLGLESPLSLLAERLTKQYSGRESTFWKLYEDHSVGTKYIRRNYTAVLLSLEKQGHIQCFSSKRRPKGTLADHVVIRFR